MSFSFFTCKLFYERTINGKQKCVTLLFPWKAILADLLFKLHGMHKCAICSTFEPFTNILVMLQKVEQAKAPVTCVTKEGGEGGAEGEVWAFCFSYLVLLVSVPSVEVAVSVRFSYCEILCNVVKFFPFPSGYHPLWYAVSPSSSPDSRRLPAPVSPGFPPPVSPTKEVAEYCVI